MRVSCIDDSIAGKMDLVGEQNVTNHIGVRINPTAQFHPATHVHRFKMLKALDVVWPYSFYVYCSPDSDAWNTEAGRNFSCTNAWTSLYHVNDVFIFLHISLYLTFSTAVYICRGFIVKDICSRYSSTAAVALLLQTPYTKCISAYSS